MRNVNIHCLIANHKENTYTWLNSKNQLAQCKLKRTKSMIRKTKCSFTSVSIKILFICKIAVD